MTVTYTAERVRRLINAKKIEGEYHVTGALFLRGFDLSGVTLPTSVGGWLDLRGSDLSGVTLPASVGGSLYLNGCDLSGVTLPTSIGGSLYLSGCRNPDPSQWWTERGEATRRRCLVVCPDDGYALVQTDADLFSAGCRKNLTREQALAHWNRSDARAKLFTAAIEGARLGEEAYAAWLASETGAHPELFEGYPQ